MTIFHSDFRAGSIILGLPAFPMRVNFKGFIKYELKYLRGCLRWIDLKKIKLKSIPQSKNWNLKRMIFKPTQLIDACGGLIKCRASDVHKTCCCRHGYHFNFQHSHYHSMMRRWILTNIKSLLRSAKTFKVKLVFKCPKEIQRKLFVKGFVVKLGKASKKLWGGGASRLPFSFFEMENGSQCH